MSSCPISPENYIVTIGRSMARERRQNGWVEKTGKKTKMWTGYWYEYVLVGEVEKRRPRSKVLGKCSELTKGAAEDKLRSLIRGEAPPETNATFEQLAAWYLKTSEGRWSEKMRGTMASIFRRQINPQLGPRIAAKLKPSEVQQAFDRIATNPGSQSESLLKKCRTHIKAVFDLAVEDERMAKNPARGLEMPKFRKPSERYLDLDECRRLLDVATGRNRLIVWTLLVVGLRPSELFALRVNDVLSGWLRVDEAVVLRSLGDTKTDDSNATIPLPPQLELELRQYIQEQNLQPLDFLFSSEAKTPMQQDNYLERVLKPLGVLAGIDVIERRNGVKTSKLNHQVLRRTTATHFQKHGQVKDTQALLRHSNAETTLKHYQKSIEESVVAGVASWENELLTGAKPPARVIPFDRKKVG